MSKINFILRKPNAQGESPVAVRHTHKGSTYEKATGVSIVPKYFDAGSGKIHTVPMAPEWNATIELVRADIETAARNLVGKGVEPDKAAMATQYETVKADRERGIRAAPKAKRFLLNDVDELKAELAELLELVEAKKREIELAELRAGIHTNRLLSKYILDYKEVKAETAAYNTTRLYANVAKIVNAFNPTWAIQDVNSETLAAFEKWLIAGGKRNLTITDTITKVKTVAYHYAKQLKLDVSDLKDHKTNVKKKRNPNVVFLTKDELQDLIDLPLTNETEKRVRDRFVLMSLTGVRYSDSEIKPDNIFNDELLFSTEKTDTDITIPISHQVKEILDRYDNTIPAYPLQHFNKVIKAICSRIDSLQRNIIIKTYKGANKPVKTSVKKFEAITAHVARRTLINLALLAGVNPVAIAGIVGHEGTDLIMNVYGSKEVGKERIADLMD